MGKSATGRGTLGEDRYRSGKLGEGWYVSGDPPGGLGWGGDISGRFRTGRGTLLEVQDGLRDPQKNPGRVEGNLR